MAWEERAKTLIPFHSVKLKISQREANLVHLPGAPAGHLRENPQKCRHLKI